MSAAKRKKTGNAEDVPRLMEPSLGAAHHKKVIHEEKQQVKKNGNGAVCGAVGGECSAGTLDGAETSAVTPVKAGEPAVTPALEEPADVTQAEIEIKVAAEAKAREPATTPAKAGELAATRAEEGGSVVGDPIIGQSQVVVGRGEVQNQACEETGAEETAQTFLAWYRHSNEDPIDEIPSQPHIKLTDEPSVMAEVGDHSITHILLRGTVPDLELLAPQVSHLTIESLTDRKTVKKLDCLPLLRCLKVLSLKNCNFPDGLPDAITRVASLRFLSLERCELSTLPSSFAKLEELETLDLENNFFEAGLPDVISKIGRLRKLNLSSCELSTLPESFKNLGHLEDLDLSYYNKFEELPDAVCELPKLRVLDMSNNENLREIGPGILKMEKLEKIDYSACPKLSSPPESVLERGLSAIKEYHHDSRGGQKKLNPVSVAVLGNRKAGKSSLIDSVKNGKRVLTPRRCTEVFKIQRMDHCGSSLKFVDFGGHEVYHVAYQMIINEKCIPVIVVNMLEFSELKAEREAREATRRLCFDWISHLYLSCPKLGAPILVLTHKDKLSKNEFEDCKQLLLGQVEKIRLEMLNNEANLPPISQKLCRIQHLADKSRPVFEESDIFEFGKESDPEETMSTRVSSLRDTLIERCSSPEFTVNIPSLWNDVRAFLDDHRDPSTPYVLKSDLVTQFPEANLSVILAYMHDIGEILWYEKEDKLSENIFHQIPVLIDMITLIFHHSSDKNWNARVRDFTPYVYNSRIVEKEEYQHLVDIFRKSGEMDEVVLHHLLKSTPFELPLAIEILITFRIVHKLARRDSKVRYIIPSLSTNYIKLLSQCDGKLELRIDIRFTGFSLPKYVQHLMTVTTLQVNANETSSVGVANNGVTISEGHRTTQLLLDHNNNKVTLQVMATVECLDKAWQKLVETARRIVDDTVKEWKASRPTCQVYCSHCLYAREPYPDAVFNPGWFVWEDGDELSFVKTFPGVDPVACRRALTDAPPIPRPLRFPCDELGEKEVKTVKKYLSNLKGTVDASSSTDVDENCPTVPQEETSATEALVQPSIINLPAVPQQSPTVIGADNSSDNSAEDCDSIMSDAVQQGYVGQHSTAELILEVEPTVKEKIKKLFNNTDEVYPVTPTRGRVMIINNMIFKKMCLPRRQGSDIDYKNLERLFKAMGFEIVKTEEDLTDLTADEIYKELGDEIKKDEHNNLGMFVLVIMSHGARGDIVYDSNGLRVDLLRVKDYLSTSRFPAMRGKPKFIIVNACAGERTDHGDSRELCLIGPSLAAQDEEAYRRSLPQSKPEPGPLKYLNVDDFLVLKSCEETFVSTRMRSRGSWFIRILTATFYKHASHTDLDSLCHKIRERVRQALMDHVNETNDNAGVAEPTHKCTFTNSRKLYLFPKYHPPP